jgi:hypothetical protein
MRLTAVAAVHQNEAQVLAVDHLRELYFAAGHTNFVPHCETVRQDGAWLSDCWESFSGVELRHRGHLCGKSAVEEKGGVGMDLHAVGTNKRSSPFSKSWKCEVGEGGLRPCVARAKGIGREARLFLCSVNRQTP